MILLETFKKITMKIKMKKEHEVSMIERNEKD